MNDATPYRSAGKEALEHLSFIAIHHPCVFIYRSRYRVDVEKPVQDEVETLLLCVRVLSGHLKDIHEHLELNRESEWKERGELVAKSCFCHESIPIH